MELERHAGSKYFTAPPFNNHEGPPPHAPPLHCNHQAPTLDFPCSPTSMSILSGERLQSDRGPQVLPRSDKLNAGQINANGAQNMVNNTSNFNGCHFYGSRAKSLGTVPGSKGFKKACAGLLSNLTKCARPAQFASPYDSDTPPLTPGSSCASSPFSSQEDVTLVPMVTHQSQYPVPQDPEDDTPTLAYHQNMLKADRGLPIFRQGCGDQETAPGDVGTYSVASGSFKRIFSVLDEDFTARCLSMALDLPPRNVNVKANVIPRNSEIHRGVSPDIKLCESNRRDVASFDFYCQSTRGAVLVATSPAEEEELDSHVGLGSWLKSHPELIYQHANAKRQLSDEEALYIVTGCIKSESCAVAAFTKQGIPPHDLLRLEPTACDGADQPSFLWTKQCAFSEATFGVSGEAGLKSQTLFITGYTMDFSSKFRDCMKRTPALSPKTSRGPAGDAYHVLSGPTSNTVHEPQQERRGGDQQSSFEAPDSSQLGRDSGRTSPRGGQGQDSNPGRHSVGRSNLSHLSEHDQVTVNIFPGPTSSTPYLHPSSRITKQLLEMTGKDFALCHDDQWRHALDKIDTAEFAQTIIAESKIVTQNGVALLEPAVDLEPEVQSAPRRDFYRHDSEDSGRQAALPTISPTAFSDPQPTIPNEARTRDIRSADDPEGDTPMLAYHQNMLKANRGLPIFRQDCGDQETTPGDVGTYSLASGGFKRIVSIWQEEFRARCSSIALHLDPWAVNVKADVIPRNKDIHRGVSPDFKTSLTGPNQREATSFDFYCPPTRRRDKTARSFNLHATSSTSPCTSSVTSTFISQDDTIESPLESPDPLFLGSDASVKAMGPQLLESGSRERRITIPGTELSSAEGGPKPIISIRISEGSAPTDAFPPGACHPQSRNTLWAIPTKLQDEIATGISGDYISLSGIYHTMIRESGVSSPLLGFEACEAPSWDREQAHVYAFPPSIQSLYVAREARLSRSLMLATTPGSGLIATSRPGFSIAAKSEHRDVTVLEGLEALYSLHSVSTLKLSPTYDPGCIELECCTRDIFQRTNCPPDPSLLDIPRLNILKTSYSGPVEWIIKPSFITNRHNKPNIDIRPPRRFGLWGDPEQGPHTRKLERMLGEVDQENAVARRGPSGSRLIVRVGGGLTRYGPMVGSVDMCGGECSGCTCEYVGGHISEVLLGSEDEDSFN